MLTNKQKSVFNYCSKLKFLGLSNLDTYRVSKRLIENSLDFRSSVKESNKFAVRKIHNDIVYYGPNGFVVFDALTKEVIVRRKYRANVDFELATALHSRYDYSSVNMAGEYK